MINKNILDQESKLLYAEIANHLGEDSWELHFCEEYVTFLTECYCDYDADDYINECISKLNALLGSLEEKFGQAKFNELHSKISNIYKMMDFLKEHAEKEWC